MRRALEYASALDITLAQHCEVAALTKGAVMHEGACCSRLGLPGWPALAEELMVPPRHRAVPARRRPDPPAAPVDGAAASSSSAQAKADGLPVTAEAAPHHFTLTDELLAGYDPVFKVNPPLRTAADIAAIKAGLADGTIDAIATDHAPHPPEAKEAPLDQAPPGMLGLETALALAIGELDMPLDRIVAALSWQPARDRPGRRSPRPPDRPRRTGEPVRVRPGARVGRRPQPPGQQEPQHAVRRPHPARQGPPHDLPGPPRRPPRRRHALTQRLGRPIGPAHSQMCRAAQTAAQFSNARISRQADSDDHARSSPVPLRTSRTSAGRRISRWTTTFGGQDVQAVAPEALVDWTLSADDAHALRRAVDARPEIDRGRVDGSLLTAGRSDDRRRQQQRPGRRAMWCEQVMCGPGQRRPSLQREANRSWRDRPAPTGRRTTGSR